MPFPLFQRWTDEEVEASFLLEGENTLSRLGSSARSGFIGLLVLLFWPSAATRFSDRSRARRCGRLTLAAVLLGTIGGFGSLVELLVTPEIRAYNRITPFIAVLFPGGGRRADRFAQIAKWRIAAAATVLAVGLADHGWPRSV